MVNDIGVQREDIIVHWYNAYKNLYLRPLKSLPIIFIRIDTIK